MNPRILFKASVVAAAIASSIPAFANSYFVVVPVPNRTANTGNINVSLNGYSLPNAMVGQQYAGFDFKSLLAVTGDPSYTGYGVRWSVAAGSLPAGLTLNSDGTLTGTPTAGGTSTFQLMVSYKNKAGQQAYQVVVANLTVALATGVPPQALVGQAFGYDLKQLLTVTGDSAYAGNGAGVTWSVVSSTLPAGLYLTNDGWIGGTPTTGGTGNITARATYKGVNGQQTYQVVSLAINVGLASATPPQGIVGEAYSYDVTPLLSVTGDPAYTGPGQVSWSVASGSLPAGLTLSSTGVITGTPTAAASGPVTLQASYRGVNGKQAYQVVTLAIAVALATGSPPQALVGQSYGYDLKPLLSVSGDSAYAGNAAGVTWTVVSSTLPAGLYLTSDGWIGGTPTVSGTGSITARAAYKGVNGQQTYQVVTLGISVALGSATLPQGIVGQAYTYDLKPLLAVTGDPAYSSPTQVSWSVASGNLPAGLSLNSDGTISGTPTTAASGNVTVQAAYRGNNGQQTYQLVTLALNVVLGSATPPAAVVGVPYTYDLKQQLQVTGDSAYTGNGAGVTWSVVSSTLAAGLTLNSSGVITGTPTASGTGSITALATYRGVNGQQAYQVVTQAVTVTLASATLPAAAQGFPYAAYDFKPLASSNDPSFKASSAAWSVVGSLPAGLALDATGVLTGTPSGSGALALTLKATYNGYSGQQNYTLTTSPSSLVTSATPSLSFPSVSDYTASTQQVTLNNTGDATGTLALSTNSSNFTVSGCSTIAPKSSCTANVTFYPTGVTGYSGTLTITGATSGPISVPLTGSAVTNVQTFTASTSWTVPAKLTSVKALVVGGGGGAEAAQTVSSTTGGRGGGGGQVVYNASFSVTPNATLAVVVGAAGDVGQDSTENGTPSSLGALSAAGGYSGYEGGASGSGYAGGGAPTATLQGGGGAGAGGPGGAGTASKAGDGGPGLCFTITGSQTCYGGGGAGGNALTSGGSAGAGGLGGGGAGGVNSGGTGGVGGTPNTGGGGAGGTGLGRGAGGTGVVIVAY